MGRHANSIDFISHSTHCTHTYMFDLEITNLVFSISFDRWNRISITWRLFAAEHTKSMYAAVHAQAHDESTLTMLACTQSPDRHPHPHSPLTINLQSIILCI